MLPPAFLLFELECALSPQVSCVRVRILAWGLAYRAEQCMAQRHNQSIGDRLQIHFDARGKQIDGIGFIFPYLAYLSRATFYFLSLSTRVPDFALELVHEAWSEWCLGAFE